MNFLTALIKFIKKPVFPILTVIGVYILYQAPNTVDPYTLISRINILMYVTLALSWSIFSGPTHYVSLASAAFFGVGVYTTAMLGTEYPLDKAIAVGAGVSFMLALVIGILTLRLKGVYFILFTFGVSALIRHSLVWYEANKENTVGRYVFGGPKNDVIYRYVLGITVATFLLAFLVKHSRLGMALACIGEDENAAAHIGINVVLVKVFGFALTAIPMGALGVIMANRWFYIDPVIAFNPLISFLPVLMAIFGGTSRLMGPIVGAAIFTMLREHFITEYPYYYMLFMGSILIFVIMYLPGGLTGLVDFAIRRLNRIPFLRPILMRIPI